MANLARRTYTRVDPETGERTTHQTRKWYGQYRDANGVVRRVPLCADKAAARAMLVTIVRDIERRVAGLIDPATERMAILELKAARRWSLERTARPMLVTAATVASWLKRIDEDGPKALVKIPEPASISGPRPWGGCSKAERENRRPNLPRTLARRAKSPRIKSGPSRPSTPDTFGTSI